MRTVILAAALLLGAAPQALAHPGVGIVIDRRGNVFYTDLTHVWRIAPNGDRAIVVRNVHTHELYLDALDNLYGEHLWYEGEQADRWGHLVWRLGATGVLDTIVKPREGFLSGYSFVRDAAGSMYWVERGARSVIRKRGADGRVADHAAGRWGDVGWLTATAEGDVYFVADAAGGGELRRVDAGGAVSLLAHRLADSRVLRPWAGGRHRLMGLHVARNGDVYLASYGTGQVKRVGADGRVSVVAESRFPWAPTGMVVGPNGDLWILEYTATTTRVRLIGADGTTRMY